jgi:hypothetical protein
LSTHTTPKHFSLQQAARLFRSSRVDRDGNEIPTHPATVSRWITTGVKAADGTRVRLEAVRSPSGWKVSRDAVDAFLARLTALALGDEAESAESADAPVSAARQRHLDRVDRELDEAFGPSSGPTRTRAGRNRRKTATATN